MTPMKAIRAKCLDCMCDQVKEVRLCPSKSCPLYMYRFGKNPARAGIGKKEPSCDDSQDDLSGNESGDTDIFPDE